MKKTLLLLCSCFFTLIMWSQDADPNVTDTIPDGWRTSGKLTLLLNQSAFSNWQAGGDDNLAASINFNYNFNYSKGVWSLTNKLLASYGTNTNEDDGLRKTDDRLELNSILGRHLKGNWSLSFFMNFKTQFTDGYDYEDDFTDQNPGADSENFPTSGFFKPAYWSFGPGFLWQKSDDLYINFAPLTSKFTFITSEVFSYNDDDPDNVFYESSNDVEIFGVDPGEDMLYELGINIRGYYKFELFKNVTIENLFSFYSDYLDRPKNIDIDYTLNIVMTINEFLSTDLTFQTIYDDNAFSGFQVREVFGLGVNLQF